MNGYGKRVLVVDDDEQIRFLLAVLLEQDGYSVHTAIGGQEALDEMKKRRFDAVVTDVEMPRTTGFEVLEFCRAVFPRVPVVLMSSAAREHQNPLERFAYAYVEKPFDGSDLLRVLRAACRTKMKEGEEGTETEQRRIGSCSVPS
jgi:DNA-binding NtrC family response regulator